MCTIAIVNPVVMPASSICASFSVIFNSPKGRSVGTVATLGNAVTGGYAHLPRASGFLPKLGGWARFDATGRPLGVANDIFSCCEQQVGNAQNRPPRARTRGNA